ncbi:copper resistance protein NlpE N-terminal domain-containing protein [Flavobacterium sp.]|uniref:copper resistance protein NlpE N-terminal domain-containing protein n=1 Tax=Flavobacterium sp. TaxID=239 RepID=UPI0025C01452|nr:copper resistance protein NlpE N-terminal domain-containing protein [Flavobacterium sp.]
MKTTTIIYFVLVLITVGCSKKLKNTTTDKTVIEKSATAFTNDHNASNSLDYDGTYFGVLPCADCEGIETTLQLTADKKYVLTTKYLGKENALPIESKGTYAWNKEGNKVILSGIKNAPSNYFVGENYVMQLDMKGQEITGDLADKYILQKLTTFFTPSDDTKNSPMKKTKWKLVELNGKKIENKDKNTKEFILQLKGDNRYTAFAGCNNLMGEYELNEESLRIKFSRGASTMMACPDMETEQEFAKMLETVDNYSHNGNQMTLNKARMAPLARFEAIKK